MFCLTACKEQIVHDLSEHEANRLITVLHEAGMEAHKEPQPDGQWSLAVATDHAIRAIQFIDQRRLIREERSQKKKSSVISSREDQRFQYERSLSSEIEQTILSIDGVFEARVHLNLPPVDPLFGKRISKIPGSASVLIVATRDFSIENSELAALVSGASGIELDKVSVIVTRSIESSASVLERQTPPKAQQAASQSSDSFAFDTDLLVRVGLAIFAILLGAFYLFKEKKRSAVRRLNAQLNTVAG